MTTAVLTRDPVLIMLSEISERCESVSLVRNRVFELVRGEILSCQLRPGEELRENELAKRYGVSKSPVRDAMQRRVPQARRALAARGLTQAMLYVDAANTPAIALYSSLGFTHWDTDVLYRRA